MAGGGARPDGGPVTVSFGDRYFSSEQFEVVFRDGMALIEETAAYLDSDGRREAKALAQPLAMAYATESMRLTTRLMQLASWLLIRRAVNAGDLSAEDAQCERRKVRLSAIGRPAHSKDFEAMPRRLKDLVGASYQLYDRVVRLDQMLGAPQPRSAESPANAQRSQLEAAFKGEQIELPLATRR